MSMRTLGISLPSLLLTCTLLANLAQADDFRVEALEEGPPAEVAPEIAKLLNPTGLKVIKGTSRTVCEIWLCKQWDAKPDFKSTSDVIYPFTPGQIMGVARYKNKGADFRDQDIAVGVYTMRYGQQPVDGAHVGTSPTRDFLLLIAAERDKSPAALEYKPLVEGSAEAAGSTHPCLLSMQRLEGDGKAPSIRLNEANEWTILRMAGAIKAGGKSAEQNVDLVVVGHFAE